MEHFKFIVYHLNDDFLKLRKTINTYIYIMKLFMVLFGSIVLYACSGPQKGQDSKPPNIILIITDDQGYGDLGIHGNPFIRTPVLDSLAGLSTRIDPFYVSPVCAPTRSSLMTGRYHLRTGVYDTYNGGAMMATNELTLAEVLADNGYNTAMVGKWHLGDAYPMRPMDQGFQYYLAHKGGGIGQPGDDFGNYLPRDSSYFDPYLWENGKRVKRDGYCSDIFTDQAIEFIKEQGKVSDDHPFFLYLSFNAPHTPLQLPEKYYEEYKHLNYGQGDFENGGSNVKEMQSRDMEDARKVYGMVSNIDDNLGRLWKTLSDLELEKNTLVIFLTDNGPQQRRYTSGLNGRKGSVLEGGIRVPCFFYWKDQLKGNSVLNYPSAHIDMMPTLLEFAGITYEGDMDGTSLVPILKGGTEPEERPLFFVWTRGYPQPYSNMAVRKGPFKLVGQTEYGESTDLLQLYNLEEDPYEQIDMSNEYPEIKADLLEELNLWYEEIIVSPNLIKPPRITIGSEMENPVILGRNDWKGPKAMQWGSSEAFGHWDIRIVESGKYQVKMVFEDQFDRPGQARIRLGTRQYWFTLEDTTTNEIIFPDVTFDRGDHTFEGWYQIRGTISTPMSIEILKY